ncbi:hypothetical protein NC651_010488 [Populus alba x Populus x berolinensis]|nr:hypothetical protein NC651_010488 [Populus alba x Populus x berolinensis]
MFALMGSLFLLDSFMVSLSDSISLQNSSPTMTSSGVKGDRTAYANEEERSVQMYGLLQNLAYSALAEICNAIALASLLNATLALPRFLYSNVWKDPSQFGDIYQEQYFMNIMKDEVNIVKELPSHLKSLVIEAIGGLITDADIVKEATPIDYLTKTLPLLLQNGVVHFLGHRLLLGFDPLPSKLQVKDIT